MNENRQAEIDARLAEIDGWKQQGKWIDAGTYYYGEDIAWQRERIRELEAALSEISDIRDHIIGQQGVHWSRDIYPLVATLNGAGLEGRPYADCKAHILRELEQQKVDPAGVWRRLPFTTPRHAASTAPGIPDGSREAAL